MKRKINYRDLFIKIAGQEKYEELINKVADKIIDEYKMEMSLDMFDKTIQASVKTVIIIGICKASGLDKEQAKARVSKKGIKRYIFEGMDRFIKDNIEYIDIVERYARKRVKLKK